MRRNHDNDPTIDANDAMGWAGQGVLVFLMVVPGLLLVDLLQLGSWTSLAIAIPVGLALGLAVAAALTIADDTHCSPQKPPDGRVGDGGPLAPRDGKGVSNNIGCVVGNGVTACVPEDSRGVSMSAFRERFGVVHT